MRRIKGFTLIELMIVCSIIAIIVALAVPNLLRFRIQSNEAATIENLRTILEAEAAFNGAKGFYTMTWADMTDANPPYLNGHDWDSANGTSGYFVTLNQDTPQDFRVNADPVVPNASGERYFFMDLSGVLTYAYGGQAGPGGLPVGT